MYSACTCLLVALTPTCTSLVEGFLTLVNNEFIPLSLKFQFLDASSSFEYISEIGDKIELFLIEFLVRIVCFQANYLLCCWGDQALVT